MCLYRNPAFQTVGIGIAYPGCPKDQRFGLCFVQKVVHSISLFSEVVLPEVVFPEVPGVSPEKQGWKEENLFYPHALASYSPIISFE